MLCLVSGSARELLTTGLGPFTWLANRAELRSTRSSDWLTHKCESFVLLRFDWTSACHWGTWRAALIVIGLISTVLNDYDEDVRSRPYLEATVVACCSNQGDDGGPDQVHGASAVSHMNMRKRRTRGPPLFLKRCLVIVIGTWRKSGRIELSKYGSHVYFPFVLSKEWEACLYQSERASEAFFVQTTEAEPGFSKRERDTTPLEWVGKPVGHPPLFSFMVYLSEGWFGCPLVCSSCISHSPISTD